LIDHEEVQKRKKQKPEKKPSKTRSTRRQKASITSLHTRVRESNKERKVSPSAGLLSSEEE